MYRVRNSFADCTLLDILHWIYQGALYFQNFIWVHGTRVHVISFKPITIVRHSQCRYSQNSPSSDKLFLDVYCTRLYKNWMKRVINWAKLIFLLLIKFVSCAILYHNWIKRNKLGKIYFSSLNKVRLLCQTVPQLVKTCNKLGKIYFFFS
jgi:hypothetical protein